MSQSLSRADMAALQDLVSHARRYSKYYAETLQQLPQEGWVLSDLPLLDTARFWRKDTDLRSWSALTVPLEEGYVFRSGGTTGNSKYSVCTREEWRRICSSYGEAIALRLTPGDRIANLFFCGNLYASYLFIHASLSHVPFPICEFPFSGVSERATLARLLADHSVNVVCGMPAHVLQLASYLDAQGRSLPSVTLMLYGGDSMFADQMPLLRRTFPNARLESIGYASVEIGALGASTPDCSGGEHRVFDGEVILEIVDEDTAEVITQTGRPGLLIATSLARRLTPLIRCPTGDLAAWCEPPGAARKFVLRGRSTRAHQVRVGYALLMPDDIGETIRQHAGGDAPWQMVLSRSGGVDRVTLRIAGQSVNDDAMLLAALNEGHPAMEDLIAMGQASWDIEWCSPSALQLDPRTGKLPRVIDRRDGVIAGETKP